MATTKQLDKALENVDYSRLIILGDLNINYANPKDRRSWEIAEAIKTYGLKDLSKSFKSKPMKPFTWTWGVWRGDKKIRAICDYILYGDKTKWKNFKVVDLPFDSDHRLIKGKLMVRKDKQYKNYIRERKTANLDIFKQKTPDGNTTPDDLLSTLHKSLEEEKPKEKFNRSWISKQTFELLKKKAKALRGGNTEEVEMLGKNLRRSLRKDRRERINKVSDLIETQLEKGDIIGAFEHIRHWYRKFTGKPLKPSRYKLEETKKVFEDLFKSEELSDVNPYNFEYGGKEVKDDIPDEGEIIHALYQMRNRKAPGLTKISIDQIKRWYELAHPEEGEINENALTNWKLVVEIIQRCFREGEIPTAFSYGILVIIPKDDNGGVRGIGLLESIHKLCSQIINLRLAQTIEFCDEVHGFRRKRGTFTAIGESKIRTQMAACESKTIYKIFLDLRKAYDSIDRKRVLRLMEKYKIGPNIRRYVAKVWENQEFVLRQAGFYSDPFEVNRGCTQGDTDSPIIFNLIIDAVLRSWKNDRDYGGSLAFFYADDGLIEHHNHKYVQSDVDRMIRLFAKMGLKANEIKTKWMLFRGAPAPRALAKETYDEMWKKRRNKPRWGKEGQEQWRRKMVECEICGKWMQNASIKRHMQTIHARAEKKYICREIQDTEEEYYVEYQKGIYNKCPVANCTGGGKDKFGLYRHFNLRHPNANIIIEQDGRLEKCILCGMRAKDMNKHQQSDTCAKARVRRTNEERQDSQAEAETKEIKINGVRIERVKHFKYLGRILSEDDCDSKCIDDQLKKTRKRWTCIAKILKREGANAACMGKFYLTIVQAVLLYGADSWVVKRDDLRKLQSFHSRAIRYMTGTHIQKRTSGEWEYPDHDKLLKKCRLFPIEEYIKRRRGTLMKFLEDYRGNLLAEAKICGRHCRDVNKIIWWQQDYRTKTEMAKLKYFWTE